MADNSTAMLPRTVRQETPIVQGGKCVVTIIHPAGDPGDWGVCDRLFLERGGAFWALCS
jgi:hypothetical protein